jgi:hypothetical protein
MPSAGFETAIPATKRSQTYALDGAAIGIYWKSTYIVKINTFLRSTIMVYF